MLLQTMKRVIDTIEALGAVETPGGPCEVYVSADAAFDEALGRLVVKLEAFLQPADLLAKERHLRAEWLPKNETVVETVGSEETVDLARDIFRRWVRKVREAAPALHHV